MIEPPPPSYWIALALISNCQQEAWKELFHWMRWWGVINESYFRLSFMIQGFHKHYWTSFQTLLSRWVVTNWRCQAQQSFLPPAMQLQWIYFCNKNVVRPLRICFHLWVFQKGCQGWTNCLKGALWSPLEDNFILKPWKTSFLVPPGIDHCRKVSSCNSS